MKTVYMILAFVRPLLFIAVVVAFIVIMLKVVRANRKRRSEAISKLLNHGNDDSNSDE